MNARLTDREKYLRSESEASFQGRIIDLARLCGWRVAHFRTVRMTRRDRTTRYLTPVQADGAGFPDLILVRGTRMVAAELKREEGKPPAFEQLQWLEALGLAGAEVAVWRPRDWDTIERTLR